MIEIKNTLGSIIAFDGRIIELFITQSSERYHVKQLRRIELIEKKKGLQIMGTTNSAAFFIAKIDPKFRDEVNKFIAQVEKAMK
ncbi:MAG: hypothetical protein H6598_03725 [Flavobacteriales bacterium]|nr:hypothetical protein [Flavobacteriales bacterium]